jgi:hypothetical protein
MYSTFVTLALLFVAPLVAGYAINQPKLVQCETAKLSWEPTKGPYNVIVVAADDPCGDAPLLDLGDVTATFINFQVNLVAGTTVQLSVADANDDDAWTGNITITGGDNKSCLKADGTTAAGGKSSGTTTPGSATKSNPGAAEKSYAAVGAANAGSNKFLGDSSAAPSSRHLSQSVAALGAVAAVAAFVL